jgi:hypothetical protein
MKPLIFIVLLLMLATPAFAERTFDWDPSPTPNIQFYTLHYSGNVSGQTGEIPAEVDAAGKVNYVLDTSGMAGDYSFYVTASNQDGTSMPSNTVTDFLGVPEAVQNFRLR